MKPFRTLAEITAPDGGRLTLHEHDGTDWSFKSLVLRECLITSASPSNTTVSGAPSATFSGISLQATSEAKAVAAVTIP